MSQTVSKCAIYNNLKDAIGRWHSGQNCFPKFKHRSHGQSYQAIAGKGETQVEGQRIKLPKIGWVRLCEPLRFLGTICKVVISKHGPRWFAAIVVDTFKADSIPDIRQHPVVGVDVGIKHLAVTSEGVYYENPKALKGYERKLKRLQRQLSRRQKGSRNWRKTKVKLVKLHYRIACIREDAYHKATTEIVKGASAIGIETLKVTNLLKNRNLAKALSDSALGGFLEKLKTKAESLSIPIAQAPQFFASSKMCSRCGHKKTDLTLSDRQYQCSRCRFTENRDVNAAINLKHLAVGHTES